MHTKELSKKQISLNHLPIDPNHLIETAREVVKELDSTSEAIANLEDGLRKINANFPFRHLIESGKESVSKQPEERHLRVAYPVMAYNTKTELFFSWEEDEESKDDKFRLFIVEIEKEIIHCDLTSDDIKYESFDFEERLIYKKPLRQLKIAARLRFSKHLQKFIDSFNVELRDLLNELHKNRFEDDVSPF
jgi:hypothetical protein